MWQPTGTPFRNPQQVSADRNRFGRKGDPRMHAAVAARLANPQISLFQALTKGGYKYREDGDDRLVDEDQVTLGQRKNQLSRRLRQARLQIQKEEKRKQQQHQQSTTTTLPPSRASPKRTASPDVCSKSAVDSKPQTPPQEASPGQLGDIGGSPLSPVGHPAEVPDCVQAITQSLDSNSNSYAQLFHHRDWPTDDALEQVTKPALEMKPKVSSLIRNALDIEETTGIQAHRQEQNQDISSLFHLSEINPLASFPSAATADSARGALSTDGNMSSYKSTVSSLPATASTQKDQATSSSVTHSQTKAGKPLSGNTKGTNLHGAPSLPGMVGGTTRRFDASAMNAARQEDQKLDTALRLYQIESRALYQRCMLLAGFGQAQAQEPSSEYLNFASRAWLREGDRLQALIAKKTAEKPNPQKKSK